MKLINSSLNHQNFTTPWYLFLPLHLPSLPSSLIVFLHSVPELKSQFDSSPCGWGSFNSTGCRKSSSHTSPNRERERMDETGVKWHNFFSQSLIIWSSWLDDLFQVVSGRIFSFLFLLYCSSFVISLSSYSNVPSFFYSLSQSIWSTDFLQELRREREKGRDFVNDRFYSKWQESKWVKEVKE